MTNQTNGWMGGWAGGGMCLLAVICLMVVLLVVVVGNLRCGAPHYDAWWGYTPYPGASLGRSLLQQDQCKNTFAVMLAANRDEK